MGATKYCLSLPCFVACLILYSCPYHSQALASSHVPARTHHLKLACRVGMLTSRNIRQLPIIVDQIGARSLRYREDLGLAGVQRNFRDVSTCQALLATSQACRTEQRYCVCKFKLSLCCIRRSPLSAIESLRGLHAHSATGIRGFGKNRTAPHLLFSEQSDCNRSK